MAHFGLRLGCWQRDCSATNGGLPELDHSNKGTGSSIRVDALCERLKAIYAKNTILELVSFRY